MIFKEGYIDTILSEKKTQTRRPARGYYQVGRSYSIQSCRGCKGIPGVRILMDAIWEELSYNRLMRNGFDNSRITRILPILLRDANAEGYMSTAAFEEAFRELYPKWDGESRWAYEYHIVKEEKK